MNWESWRLPPARRCASAQSIERVSAATRPCVGVGDWEGEGNEAEAEESVLGRLEGSPAKCLSPAAEWRAPLHPRFRERLAPRRGHICHTGCIGTKLLACSVPYFFFVCVWTDTSQEMKHSKAITWCPNLFSLLLCHCFVQIEFFSSWQFSEVRLQWSNWWDLT